jgi:hypothetical protein
MAMPISSLDISAMDPETYFEQALMWMSSTNNNMTELSSNSSFALTTCPDLCKCSMCESLNRSNRSFATISSGDTDIMSDTDSISCRSSDRDQVEVVVESISYWEGEPARIVLPVSEHSSAPSSSTLNSYRECMHMDTKRAVARRAKADPPSADSNEERTEEKEIRYLESQLKRLQGRHREMGRQRLRMEIEKDDLKLMLEESRSPATGLHSRSRSSAKLERIHEHGDD